MFNNQLILNAQGANVISSPFLVSGWKILQMNVSVSGTSSGSGLSLRFPSSSNYSVRLVDTKPDFTTTSSATNFWNYIFFNDANSGVNYQGDTGASFDGATSYLDNGEYTFLIQSEGLVWIGAEIFNWVGGTVSVSVTTVERTTT